MAGDDKANEQNGGEGNREADKAYRESTREFIKNEDVEAQAKAAREALEGEDAEDLKRAEAAAKKGETAPEDDSRDD